MNVRNALVLQQRIFHCKFICRVELKLQFGTKNDDGKSISEEITKESLQWRRSWDRQGEWYSKLKLFASDSNNTNVIKFLQSPIDLWPSSIMKWYLRKQQEIERNLQQYLPERNKMLGNELAAAHFIVFRGGKVKFHGNDNWISQDENLKADMPNTYDPRYVIKAIDCSDLKLYYEGLANFQSLDKLEWFSLNGCKNMDDWCMDRISNIFQNNVKYLDIRNCNNITHRGIGALYRSTKLEELLVDNINKSKEFELTCLMLQELLPNLNIKSKE